MLSRWLVLVFALLVPLGAHAQVRTGTLSGVITDESKGVLPGVTVTATDLQTGRQYIGVTDERGAYQLVNLPPGAYRLEAVLASFATAQIPTLDLLVGQNVTASFMLKLATVQETVTVTSEAPLVDVTSSQVAGNVDRRQMEELPLQGRNWMELSMLVKGITANNVTTQPGVGRDEYFQLNLDGQQITQKIASSGFGQPKFSREAIAEFQIATNLFDITQGRSTLAQVQVISRSGTNNLNGAVYGFFRDDRFNAPDFVAKRVLPFSNQQAGGAVGGPIVRDKLHYFVSYEYERQPDTIFTIVAALGGANYTFPTKQTNHSYLGRADWQLSSKNSLTVRASSWRFENPFTVGGTSHPSNAIIQTQDADSVVGSWSRVLSPNKLAEFRVGYNGFAWSRKPLESFDPLDRELNFPGVTIGPPYNLPQWFWQDNLQFRSDFTWTAGSHNVKIGGELLRVHDTGEWHLQRRGRMFFLSTPSVAEMLRRFPADAWNDPSRWDLTGLDPLVQRLDINFHRKNWLIDIPRPTFAVWIGDTWRIGDRLTINYGVRWDDDWGATAPPGITETVVLIDNGFESGDFGQKSGIRDHNNVAPRAGFTWNVGGTSDFVIRGGSGLYYSTPVSNVTFSHQLFNQAISASFVNDGQPGFASDPLRGRSPDDFLSGRVPVQAQTPRTIDPKYRMPYSWQSGIGFQKGLGAVTVVEADLTHWALHNDVRTRDPNLFYDPATGYNKDPQFGRPNPQYSQVPFIVSSGRRDYLGLATGLTRRYQKNVQAGVTYTRMFYMHDDGTTGYTQGEANNQFDLPGDWARSTDFQRNTLRLWGMYQLPAGFSVSGVYFYGSGNYYGTVHPTRPYGKPGTNRLNLGPPVAIPEAVRDRFEGPAVIGTGEVVPRNALRGFPLHKVDLRVTKLFRLGGDTQLSLTAEVFNLFNHANYGNYEGQVTARAFGEPRQALGNAYAPRSGQFGFRLSF